MEPATPSSLGPETPLTKPPNAAKLAALSVHSPVASGLKRFVETADGMLLDDSQVISEEDVAREAVDAYPPRTLAHPFVSDKPASCLALAFDDVASSCIITSTLFKLETPDTPLDDFVLPIDDSIDPNTYVGDWEEIFIPTYNRLFSAREHQLYWAKSELGIFVTAVARATPGVGHPTLSLGPNGYHYAYLPSSADVLDFPRPKALTRLFPHLEECQFQLAKESDKLAHEMLSFEQKMKPTRYKFGLLYIREGQTEENEFYGNLDPSTGFIDFCKRLGQLIELKGHAAYRGGLDVKGGTTGELSLYTAIKLADGRFVNRGGKVPADACEIVDLEIMFHVAPFLPHSSAKDDQQLHKKRHLGNDIVIVIYKDGHTTISPDVFKSQFNHVYVVVTPCAATQGAAPTHYKVEVVTKGLKRFLPQIPENNRISVDKVGDWLLLKLINGEMASMRSKDFRLKMKRTRVQTLESWAKDTGGPVAAKK